MMSDSKLEKGILQENIDIYDTDKIDITVSGSDVSLNESQKVIMQEFCDNNQIVISKDSTLQESIAKIIGKRVATLFLKSLNRWLIEEISLL